MTLCLDNDTYNEKWELTSTQQLRHIETNMCLDYDLLNAQDHILAQKCDPYSETQKWRVEK